jgi:NAD(P)-dependent dehydrogenase (short-subunit alcohol dehydrogenase family)
LHDVVDVHLKGSFWVTQAAYRVMKEHRYGRVVFTTSGSGLYGRADSPGYVSAKAGIVGLMSSLAIEGAPHNVLANAVAPLAYTRMTSFLFDAATAARMRPELVSDVVVYLASEECAITHEVIEAGLGLYARVFIGRTSGWRHDPAAASSPEDFAAHLAMVRDLAHFVVPATAQEDLADVLEQAQP